MPRYRRTTDRGYQPREQRLVSDFIRTFFTDYPHFTRVRLGRTPWGKRGELSSPEVERLVGVFRRVVDALILLPDRVVLIEGDFLPDPRTIGELRLYRDLFPQTPEFTEHKDKPLELVWVLVLEDPVASALARRHEIKPVVFAPYWARGYVPKHRP